MNNFKRILSLGLAMVMILSLAGCGKESEQDRVDMEAVKQGVYKSTEIYVAQQSDNGDVNFNAIGYVDGKVYMVETTNSYGIDEETEMWFSNTSYALKTMNLDGTGVNSTPIEGMEQISGTGNVYTYFNNLQFTEHGFFGIMNYENYEQMDENGMYQREVNLVGWDLEGKKLFKTQLNDPSKPEEWYYADTFIALADGKLLIKDNTGFLSLYDSQGNLIKKAEVEGMDMVNNFFVGKGNQVYVVKWTEDWMSRHIHPYDVESGVIGEAIELPFSLNNYSFYSSKTHDLMLSRSNTGFYYFDFDTEMTEPKMMMNYINSDFVGYDVNNFIEISDTQFMGSYYDTTDYMTRIGVFDYVDPSTIPDKKALTIACYWMDSRLKKRIIDFNKTSELYRISVEDYSQYATEEDYTAGYTRLNNDILAGKIPDMMVLDQNMPIESYISKGLFADIYEFIDNDPELNREDYFANVFEAFSRNGELYCIVPQFQVNTVVVKKSDVGDMTGWTMQEAMEILNSKPEGTSFFAFDENRNSQGYTLINNCLTQYVDLNTGLCNFNSQSFKDVLTYVASLPEEANINYDDPDIWNKYETQYRDGTTLAANQSVYSFDSLVYNQHGMFGEPIVYIGYPTEDRNGSNIYASNQYAITTKAEKDGAWEFLRYYLTPEYQETVYNFPVHIETWWSKSEVATKKPTWTDENGEVHEEEYTYWMNGESIILEPMSQEEIQDLYDFITSVTKVNFYDEDITNIIQEEVEGFYSGQKSVDEVVDIIQNRVQLYVDENR
ncbi:MAG: extracellular solute-binding protein [Lachnospiraceae bacterium]|nr:extracellular solute-binding protein [Lachnospiraceae bacterium]